MKKRESLGSWPTDTVETAGGDFEEVEARREELVEVLHAGPSSAAPSPSLGPGT